jgi:hypothetical protein
VTGARTQDVTSSLGREAADLLAGRADTDHVPKSDPLGQSPSGNDEKPAENSAEGGRQRRVLRERALVRH